LPVGSHLVSAARAVIEVDLSRLREGLHLGRNEVKNFAGTATRELDSLSLAELRVARAAERVTLERRRYDGEAQHSITSTLRLREAEERYAQASRQAAAADAHQLYELKRLAESRGVAGRGFLLFHRNVRQATGALDEHGRALNRTNRETERHGRLRERARGLAGFGVSSILGLGIGFGAERLAAGTIEAATEDQAAIVSLRTQLGALGISYAKNREEIEKTLQVQGALSGFMQHELIQSFTTFVRRTGDVNQALHLNAVAMDIARARHISLTQVAFLLNRAMNGNTRAATSLGLPLVTVTKNMDALRASGEKATHAQIAQAKAADKYATGQAVIAEAQKRFAGQAEAYGRTAAGAQARLNRAFHETEVTVGTALLPTITRLATHLANYLNRLQRTGQLQRDVSTAMRVTGQAVRGLITLFRLLRAILGPIVRLFGGVKGSVVALGVAFGALKLAGLIATFTRLRGGLRGVGAAAGTAGTAGEVSVLSKALGNSGLVASVGLASFALTTLILRLTGADKLLRSFGGDVQSLISRLPGGNRTLSAVGLGDAMQQYAGKVTPTQAQATAAIAAARRMRAEGYSKAQIIGQFYRWHPDWDPGAIEVFVNAAFKPRGAAAGDPGRGADIGNTEPPRPGRSRGRRGPYADIRLDDTGGLVIPFAIRKALAINPEDQRALEAELAYIKRAIASRKLHGDNLIQALTDERSIEDQLAAKTKAEADKLAAARRKHAREHAAAERRHRQEVRREARVAERRRERSITGQLIRFRARLIRAEATPQNNDDLAVLDAEATYLESEIRNKHLALSFRQRLERELNTVNQQILRAKKKTTKAASDFAALERGAISTLQEIIGNESNFQQTNVNVHQYFQHPPTQDGHREAQVAHYAAMAAFA
jgi:hypothetical protein